MSFGHSRHPTHDTGSEQHCDETARCRKEGQEGAAVVVIQREGCPEQDQRHQRRNRENLQPGLADRASERRGTIGHHQLSADEGEHCAEEGDPAADHDVHQAAELDRDAEQDQDDIHQQTGARGLRTTDPADPPRQLLVS